MNIAMTEIEDLLTRYNVDSQNSRLRDFYEADNLWRTLRIERDENRHSAFLAWLLNIDAVQGNSPLLKLLNLIIRLNDNDEDSSEYKELKMSILLNRLKLKSVQFSVEKVISALSVIRYNDRLDIYADCEISGVGDYSRLEIFIENKIDSTEGNSKVSGKLEHLTSQEESYKNKNQTERYYYACSKEHNMRKTPFDGKKTLQLFVFLTALKQAPQDKHFVTVTYQDLVDFILEPYLNRGGLDAHTSMVVKEYLRILGNPLNNMTIMATTSEEKELLIDFYKRNEDLFKRALEVMRDNADSEEEEQNFKAMLDSMKKSKVRRFFKINGDEKEYKMYEVVAEFVKYLRRDKGMTFEDAEEVIKKYSKEGNCHVSVNRNEVKRSEKSFETDFAGEPFYVTKEWGLGTPGRNFDGLQKGIKQDFPDFVIKEL